MPDRPDEHIWPTIPPAASAEDVGCSGRGGRGCYGLRGVTTGAHGCHPSNIFSNFVLAYGSNEFVKVLVRLETEVSGDDQLHDLVGTGPNWD
ncbi:hypothetical protein GCM10009550_74090 [Actinocorallia libanotica]|uniref:Uncharacterized protein n=1 Tax=Actinocorallia libanotica TaxID=46162 RepID=A0ABN1RZG6_9ACTN